jgi:hypothetical protein
MMPNGREKQRRSAKPFLPRSQTMYAVLYTHNPKWQAVFPEPSPNRVFSDEEPNYCACPSFFIFFSRRSSFLLSSRVVGVAFDLKSLPPSLPFIVLPLPSIPFGNAILAPHSSVLCLIINRCQFFSHLTLILRSRMDFGVTSTSSSSLMYSMACSRVN